MASTTEFWTPSGTTRASTSIEERDHCNTREPCATQRADGESVIALGDAYRKPKDGSQPLIGEEIAAARALASGAPSGCRARVPDRAGHTPVGHRIADWLRRI